MNNILNTPKKKIAAALIAAVVIIGCIYLATTAAGASNSQNRGIGLEKSIAVALADAGLKQDQVQNLKGSFDKEDGLEVYDVYFQANGFEYEYTIKAADGTILESEIETMFLTTSIEYSYLSSSTVREITAFTIVVEQ